MGGSRRSLPGPIVDLVRDGLLPPASADAKRVYGALVRSAMSACQRGWSYSDWHAFVIDPRSQLGVQVARTHARAPRTLSQAWDRAIAKVESNPPMTCDEARDAASCVEAAIAADARIDCETRLVLQHAVDFARRQGTLRPALPWRAVRDETGGSEWGVKRVLKEEREGTSSWPSGGDQGSRGAPACTGCDLPQARYPGGLWEWGPDGCAAGRVPPSGPARVASVCTVEA